MLLANPFTHDTRVEKEARSLAAWGLDVHILAIARTGLPMREIRGGVTVHRIRVRTRYVVLLAVALAVWPFRPLLDAIVGTAARGTGPARGWRAIPGKIVTVAKRAVRAVAAAGRRIVGAGQRSVRRLARVVADQVRRTRGGRVVLFQIRRVRAIVGVQKRRGTRSLRRWLAQRRKRARAAISRFLVRYLPVPVRLLGLNCEMARRARALAPDVMHAHDLNTLLGGMIVKRLDGAALVYDSHELFLERNIGNNSRRVDRLVWTPVEKVGIKHADAVFSVSEGICRVLEERYGLDQVHLLRNVQRYEPPPERKPILHRKLDLDPDTRIAIYAGGITYNRGLELMIDSADVLDRAVYVIMGYALDESYLEGLRERARERNVLDRKLFFCDAVPMSEVVEVIASADIGMVPTINACLSYYYEASNKMFHCLMAGVPLAMSDHPEKRLLAERHGVGILFDETGDPRAIAEAVNEVLNDEERCRQLRERCLTAARMLNWEHEEYRLRTVYAGLLGNRAPDVPEPVITSVRQPPVPDVEHAV